MPKKYHISVQNTPLDLNYIYKFKIVRGENCINCGRCTKVCIYEAHKRRKEDPRKMAEPNTVVCKNCFRCIQECPRGALEKSLSGDFTNISSEYWTPDMLISLWKQAETGSVPVSGAGYRGPFTGEGFNSMWTDMSEIVRPTRDGIHGREYISTSVDLGRKLNHLAFDTKGNLTSKIHDTIAISIPIILDISDKYFTPHTKEAIINAAVQLDTFVIMPVSEIPPEFEKYINNIIPRFIPVEIDRYKYILKKARLAAIDYSNKVSDNYKTLHEKIKQISNAIIITCVSAGINIENDVVKLAHNGAEVIQIVADYRGQGFDGSSRQDGRFLKDIIRTTHLALVEERIRDEITIIASGGIAMAEYVPKAMLCGADLTVIDIPLLIALGAKIYEEPEKLLLPEGLDKIPLPVITQRITNLMGAWHSQILEMMGAMGIREIRRLRGESGRAIFFEEIDNDTFGRLFKNEKQ